MLATVVFGAATKPANAATFQAGFDALTVFDPNAKGARMSLMSPTLSAHEFFDPRRKRKSVPLGGLDDMHGSGSQHFIRVVAGRREKVAKMGLSLKAGFTPLRFFSSATFSSTAQFITSVEDSQQISRYVVDCTVTINTVKQSLFFVPSSER